MKETSGIHAEYRVPSSIQGEAEHCLMAAQRVVLPVLGVSLTSQGSLDVVRVSRPARFWVWGGVRGRKLRFLDGRSPISVGGLYIGDAFAWGFISLRFCCARPPVHFGDVQLTRSQKTSFSHNILIIHFAEVVDALSTRSQFASGWLSKIVIYHMDFVRPMPIQNTLV